MKANMPGTRCEPSRLIAACFIAALGCNSSTEKPDPYTCSGRCAPTSTGPRTPPPPPPDAGTGGDPGTDDTPVRVTGDVAILDSVANLEASDFVDPADLVMEGQNGDSEGRWNGSDPFVLEGVRRGPSVWVEVTPLGGDALRTLQAIDTRSPDEDIQTSLTVVRASEIELAFSVLPTPIAPDANAAQAVLVAFRGGVRTAGVEVSAPAAEAVIYVDNGGFTDDATMTDGSGIFLLANLPASPWPGSTVSVTLTGAVIGRADLRVVRGGVTFGAVGN